MGTLYYGDNLDILKRYIKDDLVLDLLDDAAQRLTSPQKLAAIGSALISPIAHKQFSRKLPDHALHFQAQQRHAHR